MQHGNIILSHDAKRNYTTRLHLSMTNIYGHNLQSLIFFVNAARTRLKGLSFTGRISSRMDHVVGILKQMKKWLLHRSSILLACIICRHRVSSEAVAPQSTTDDNETNYISDAQRRMLRNKGKSKRLRNLIFNQISNFKHSPHCPKEPSRSLPSTEC